MSGAMASLTFGMLTRTGDPDWPYSLAGYMRFHRSEAVETHVAVMGWHWADVKMPDIHAAAAQAILDHAKARTSNVHGVPLPTETRIERP